MAARSKRLRASIAAGLAVGVCACRVLVGVDGLQFTDAASSGDGASQDSPMSDDGGDGMTMACSFDPDAKGGFWTPPNPPDATACSPAEIAALYTACGDPMGCTQDACVPLLGSECARCITAPGGAVMIAGNTPLPNFSACVAAGSSITCAQEAYNWELCAMSCCGVSPEFPCEHPMDTQYVACVYQAMASNPTCTPYWVALKACLMQADADVIAQCELPYQGSTFTEQEQYTIAATIQCSM